MMEPMDIVLVHPFESPVAKVFGELVESLDAEEAEEPLLQDQLPVEGKLWTVVSATNARGHQRQSISNIRRWKSSSMRRTFHVSSGAFRFSRLLPPFT